MSRKTRPGIDRLIAPLYGVSRDGQPLSYNRAPASDLAPWIARLYASDVSAPDGHRLECSLFNDTSVMRFQLKGDWTAVTADGERTMSRAALFFGPHSRAMPIVVSGSFTSVGIALRPGTAFALTGAKIGDFRDRLAPCDQAGFPGQRALAVLDQCRTPEAWLQALESFARGFVAGGGGNLPDPVTTCFELAALADPTISVGQFAEVHGLEPKRLKRIVRRDFGMSPKQVLRRARALDMAAFLRGVADQAEEEELLLRYYDQSHLIREFIDLFGMSPTQFVAKPQPILTLALESRQARRLEMLARLAPGQRRPWEQAAL